MTPRDRNARTRVRGGGAPRRQADFWNSAYQRDPTFFGSGGSPFLEWVLSSLGRRTGGRTWLELGSGYGRDLRELERRGFPARGVDVSRVGISLARSSGVKVVHTPALPFLTGLEAGSAGVVFSNLFLNMEFSERDHERLFGEIHRVLAPGGYHAYSARSTLDPWYGKGVPMAPDTFDLTPDGPVMHFFSRPYARRLRRALFRAVRSWEGREDQEGFHIRVLYVLDQKAPRGPG